MGSEHTKRDSSAQGSTRTSEKIMKHWFHINIFRPVLHFYQRLTRGWDDSESWNLDYTVAKLMLPRIKKYREGLRGHPACITEQEWTDILDQVEWSFAYILYSDDDFRYLPADCQMTSRDMDLLMTWPWKPVTGATEEEKTAARIKFEKYCEASGANDLRCQQGLDLFGKWLRGMWN